MVYKIKDAWDARDIIEVESEGSTVCIEITEHGTDLAGYEVKSLTAITLDIVGARELLKALALAIGEIENA